MSLTSIESIAVAHPTALTANRIALQKGFVLQQQKSLDILSTLTIEQKMSIQAELMKLGYILSEAALNTVTKDWFDDIILYLKSKLGVGDYKPFYTNFPVQVMEADEASLYLDAIFHYWTDGTWVPDAELTSKGFVFENTNFKLINVGTEENFMNIFTTLVSINQSLTENDKEVVTWFVREYHSTIQGELPSSIPFKETLCMLASFGLNVPVKTPTDVLRIAIYLSGGDISLPAVPSPVSTKEPLGRRAEFYKGRQDQRLAYRDKFKFKRFSRSERKMLLSFLERTNLDLGEMKLKINRWLRLGEVLHPGEFKNKYPRSFEAFNTLRNNPESVQTFESKLEAAFKLSSFPSTGLSLLSQRPGYFARKLDWLLRNYDTKIVFDAFKKIAPKVSRKILWEMYEHFGKRDVSQPRSVMVRGKRSVKKQLDALPPMKQATIDKIKVEILNCLGEHFKALSPLGSVWVDERLKKIPLPSSMRSINTSVKTYVRGTRIPFNPMAIVIRPFVHWFDEEGTEDIDLSVGFYRENLAEAAYISYTNLRDNTLNSCHSGDVIRRKGACAEYVDIDIQACLNNGIRYAMVQVHNFQQRPMHTMKDCVFGIMEREFPESDPTFIPKTISNAVKLANESSTVCVVMLDLKEKEYIWCDLELEHRGSANFESSRGDTAQMIRGMIFGNRVSVYDLLKLHAQSRGEIVNDKLMANTCFEYEDFVSSYEKSASYM